jgi:hypothetical protein
MLSCRQPVLSAFDGQKASPGYYGRVAVAAKAVNVTQCDHPTGKSVLFIGMRVKPMAKKYFCFTEIKMRLYFGHPVPSEGHCARSPMRDGNAVDADGAPDPGVLKRTAKSCGPDTPRAGVKFALKAARMTVAKAQGSPRRARISRKPLRGECRVIPV